MRRVISTTAVALVFLLLSCTTTTGPGGQKSFIFIPVSQEVAIGQGMAEQLKQTEKALPDQQWQDYLTRVGKKIVSVCDRKDIEYHFTVIESDEINAFAAPGGYVYFYTGLLRNMENEGEMAAVMAHEISHVVARHGIKRLQTALGATMAYQLVFGESDSKVLGAAIQVGLGLLFADYSRDAEREADRFGIEYMVRAGYNPDAAVTMFDKLARLGGGGGGGGGVWEKLASSHPNTQERITNARSQISAMTVPGTALTGREEYQRMLKRLPAAQKP